MAEDASEGQWLSLEEIRLEVQRLDPLIRRIIVALSLAGFSREDAEKAMLWLIGVSRGARGAAPEEGVEILVAGCACASSKKPKAH